MLALVQRVFKYLGIEYLVDFIFISIPSILATFLVVHIEKVPATDIAIIAIYFSWLNIDADYAMLELV